MAGKSRELSSASQLTDAVSVLSYTLLRSTFSGDVLFRGHATDPEMDYFNREASYAARRRLDGLWKVVEAATAAVRRLEGLQLVERNG